MSFEDESGGIVSREKRHIHCDQHGSAFMTFICEHLAADPKQTWYSSTPTEDNQWPDSWCSVCHAAYMREGQWNERNEDVIKARLFCHRCYELHRAQGSSVDVADYEIPD
jgi:hypothetical protein